MKKFTNRIILLFILISGTFTLGLTQNLSVSGISDPSEANGLYIKQGTQLFGYDYWKHESGNYHIYNDDYAGRYWNIDNDTNDENDVSFYNYSDVASPVGLTGWAQSPASGATGTGVPVVAEESLVSAPTVTTNAASPVLTTGATLKGTVNANSASTTVTFNYGLTTSYGSTVTADQSPVTGSSDTPVSKAISGLSPNTTYHFRVVGVNSEGSTNGSDESFTTLPMPATVTTQAVSGISTTTAIGNGTVTDLGDPNPHQHGVCWNTGGTPTLGDSKTEDGAVLAIGAFTSSITGLNPNTMYYVRAYVTNTAGTTYGIEVSFTTDPEVPTVTTQDVSSIGMTTATGNGNVTYLGAPNPTQHGVCWGTSEYPTTAGDKTTEGVVSATGAFTSSITGLSPNTMYYVRAYATNVAGTSYGTQVSFTTDPEPATVTTQEVTDIEMTTATGNGTVTDLGDPNPHQHGVCWNTGGTPTLGDSKTEDGAVSAIGAFTSSITGLSPNTMYYVRAYVTNTAGTTYGQEVSFTADPELPTVTTQAVTSITQTTATGNGNITDLGAPNPTQHGVCWSTSTGPTTGDSKTEEGAVGAIGAFSSGITSLTPGTMYYVRAYATNTAGTVYGSEVSFTTLNVPTVTTNATTELTATTVTLNGTINANNASTDVTFEYGLTDSYGTTVTANQSPVTGTSDTPVSFELTGLSPSTTYHFRVVGVNVVGTSNGSDISFTTLTQDPIVTTISASGVEPAGAILNGTVNANDLSTTVTFEYGLTDVYGSTITADQSPVTGTSNTDVTASITGLTSNTTYHFRVVGENSAGTTNGSDLTFETLPKEPTATTSAASDIEPTEAVLNGVINANDLSTAVTFEYGLTTAYGTTVTADQSPATGTTNTDVSVSITGLTPNNTYHFRVIGQNSDATVYGDDQTFTTTKYDQVITFAALADKTTDDVDFDPGATSDLGLVISYASNNELVATIVDDLVHIIGAGTVEIIASQAGNDTVNSATPVSQSLTVTEATSIENTYLASVRVFPNPASEILNIDVGNLTLSENVKVLIVDLSGKTVFCEKIKDSNYEIDVSDFSSGLYFVEISTSVGLKKLKLIIE